MAFCWESSRTVAPTLRNHSPAAYAALVLDWDFRSNFDAQPQGPIYMRIVGALTEGIRTGRLRPGVALPGTRRLAESLGVHRSTVLAAFRELITEGKLETRPSQGTFVAETHSHRRGHQDRPVPRALGIPTVPKLQGPAGRPDTLVLGHLPSGTDFPGVPLARAYRHAVRRRASEVLDYANRTDDGATLGNLRLREALGEMLSRSRGLAANSQNLLVTNGSQMALYLLAHTLVTPGDVVAVECFGYGPVWEAFRLAGATLVPLPVDHEGVCVEHLREIARQGRLRAVYVTPHHQHPTGVMLTPARRRALLELAAAENITVIEDDYDCDFAYDGRSMLAMASKDPKGQVVYVGSLAKVLGPGVRIGYAVAPPALLESMARRRAFIDRQGDHAVAYAVAELLEDGHLRRHVHHLYDIYRKRRDVLAQALQHELGGLVSFDIPQTGTALWARVAPDLDVERWHQRARERGVLFRPGRTFAFENGPCAYAHFGYASLDESGLRSAARRLASALPTK
ncbi:MAG: PLP-dependent aminotransferase family protein [Nannocystaceae bacterium]|nr:PLP-dependent aminotransferase family protein [Nannocystaceae bacterium]